MVVSEPSFPTIEINETAEDDKYIPRHITRPQRGHCVVALGLLQDDRQMSVQFYEHCMGIVR